MMLTTLIKELQQFLDKYGDAEVFVSERTMYGDTNYQRLGKVEKPNVSSRPQVVLAGKRNIGS